MIDYFMVPFCAPDDKSVLAAMAQRVNDTTGAPTGDAIIQAPHHFEIWKLGEVEENGHIKSEIDFLADCSSLVRSGIRNETQTSRGDRPVEGVPGESRGRPVGDRAGPGTHPQTTKDTAPTEARKAAS